MALFAAAASAGRGGTRGTTGRGGDEPAAAAFEGVSESASPGVRRPAASLPPALTGLGFGPGPAAALQNPLASLVATTVMCTNASCANVLPWKNERALCLSLPLRKIDPFTGHPVGLLASVQACLKEFLDGELLPRDYKCDKCGRKGTSIRRAQLTRLPRVLCLHLNRKVYDAFGRALKLSHHVHFDATLDLTDFVAAGRFCAKASPVVGSAAARPAVAVTAARAGAGEHPASASAKSRRAAALQSSREAAAANDARALDAQHHKYCLSSVVVHHGGHPEAGHYTAYRRVPVAEDAANAGSDHTDPRWLHVSDTSVHEVPRLDTARVQAFMLFYERADGWRC